MGLLFTCFKEIMNSENNKNSYKFEYEKHEYAYDDKYVSNGKI